MRSSGGGLVFEGPAGSASRACSRLRARRQAQSCGSLSARGGELERELPFGVVRQLLEPVVAAAGDDERDALLAGAAALAKPVLFAADPEAVAEPSFSALHGLYWLTINLADAGPLLLSVDDAQWADLASLRWLIYLARRLAGCRWRSCSRPGRQSTAPCRRCSTSCSSSRRSPSSTRTG